MASRSSNRAAVPEAKGALDKFKYEVKTDGRKITSGFSECRREKRPGLTWALFSDKIFLTVYRNLTVF